MAALDCMNAVELSPSPRQHASPFPMTVAAWNLERCYFPAESAALLAAQGASAALLSELDRGMARTGQRHTARDLAGSLQMQCAYAVEFLELELGSPKERTFCTDAFNDSGFHGNAVLSASPMRDAFLFRLDDHGHWFTDNSPEPRIGGRCAVGATIDTSQGPLLLVSVHLESRADAAWRAAQFRLLLDWIDAERKGMAVILGGDLNTGLADAGDHEAEPLFGDAFSRGYSRWGASGSATTVRKSRLSDPTLPYKLDWFLTRNVDVQSSRIVPALGGQGELLSDHEMIVIEVSGLQQGS